ncbi:MAG: aminomethyl-transferring glycine dehydrogenase subunit GcvPA [Thermodesulfobacteriota bacterium]|nr:aminomethyl-transferring glycine dehydrogenase subunit GcvPA [Thermodesulfobacteriota bacterium]
MSFTCETRASLETLLNTIGIDKKEDVFSSIPEDLLFKGKLNIPEPMDEEKIRRKMDFPVSGTIFAGGGIYRHHIPSAVDALTARQEFFTAYTPYQPEISQGTLQSIFEYQSMMADLTGMHASNASMYDGATALAEAALMAIRKKHVKKVFVSRATNPSYRAVLQTYLASHVDVAIIEIPFDPKTGRTDMNTLNETIDKDSAVFIQNPNFFGICEPMKEVSETARNAGMWGIVVNEAISLGILEKPGAFGPDIVLGEAQSFGNPVSAGGPLLGFMCVKKNLLRAMPGRVVGLSRDKNNTQSFCLTLATREQHIRREKATSNICSNQGLCALRAAVYLNLIGPQGLRDTALQCAFGARYLRDQLMDKGINTVFSGPFFHEFVIRMDTKKRKDLIKKGIVPGVDIQNVYPEIPDGLLVNVTEMNTKKECACLIEHL